MRQWLHLIRTVGLVLLAPIALLVAVIFAVDFLGVVLQLYTGHYSANFGQDLGFYLVFLPAVILAVGVRQMRNML